jgi:glycosidase
MLSLATAGAAATESSWWQTDVMYQVYPRSFQDSNGDGTGDLKGIEQRLPYLQDLGVGFIWLSPVMTSPMQDFGYDIADYRDIDPIFGSMEDMDALIAAAKKLGIKLLMDFVPNHTSNQSKWFSESRSSKTNPKRDWYIWHPGKTVDGRRVPPNNWASNFGGPEGSSWTWDEATQEYYYHAFGEFQPDLNYRNPDVVAAVQDVLRFWLDRGIAGFRIDAVPFLLEDQQLPDEPVDEECLESGTLLWSCMDHRSTQNFDGIHEIVRGWRRTVDEYEGSVLFGEIYAESEIAMSYYGTPDAPEFHVPFNFVVLGENYGHPNDLSNATTFREAVRDYVEAKPAWGHGNWVLGNHDNHRLMQRMGNSSALCTAAYAVQNLLPGTPTVYYGDELAMEDLFIRYDQCKDPSCIKNPDKFWEAGRDPERTPMQWDGSAQAGFSNSSQTWLPVHPNYKKVNAAEQTKAVYSPLSAMKRVLSWRRQHPELALGKVVAVPAASSLPSDIKHSLFVVESELSSGERALTVGNLDTARTISFDLQVLRAGEPEVDSWQLVIATHSDPRSVVASNVTLLPAEVGLLVAASKVVVV